MIEHHHDLPIDPEKFVDELAKQNLTNIRLSADGFTLCMPRIKDEDESEFFRLQAFHALTGPRPASNSHAPP